MKIRRPSQDLSSTDFFPKFSCDKSRANETRKKVPPPWCPSFSLIAYAKTHSDSAFSRLDRARTQTTLLKKLCAKQNTSQIVLFFFFIFDVAPRFGSLLARSCRPERVPARRSARGHFCPLCRPPLPKSERKTGSKRRGTVHPQDHRYRSKATAVVIIITVSVGMWLMMSREETRRWMMTPSNIVRYTCVVQ